MKYVVFEKMKPSHPTSMVHVRRVGEHELESHAVTQMMGICIAGGSAYVEPDGHVDTRFTKEVE
jgi:hypothetical protein